MNYVFVIKNNGADGRIYDFACESYNNGIKRCYNTSENDKAEIEKNKTLKNSIVLLVNYDGETEKEIKSVFIGDIVNINSQNNLEYIMRVFLKNDYNERAIKSIVDKIDLDLVKDFKKEQYVFVSKMRSLYIELLERINAKKPININAECLFNRQMDMERVYQDDSDTFRIYPNDSKGKNRSEFQRDRERVVNCKAFRRLVDKAQIFGSSKGDYYRTRMTHSLEVNQIAKAIAYALGLNLDLTEAIALGHDIGHTPFGHQGERTLDDILKGKINVGIEADGLLEERCFGGFKHNYQSARILAHLEEKYIDYLGLNVSVQVIDGVLKHTKIKGDIKLDDFLDERYIDCIHIDMEDGKYKAEQICATLEGQVVAVADEIAQRGHDVDDALTSGVMSIHEFINRLEIPKCEKLRGLIDSEKEKLKKSSRVHIDTNDLKIARIVSCIIKYFITEAIDNSIMNIEQWKSSKNKKHFYEEKLICLSETAKGVNDYLERVVNKKVICNSEVARADYNANMIVKTLFQKYYSNPRLLHEGTIHKIFVETLMHEKELVANSAVNLSDAKVELANDEIDQMTKAELKKEEIIPYLKDNNSHISIDQLIIFEKRKILVRAITDYIAGMTDGYALQEYERLK